MLTYCKNSISFPTSVTRYVNIALVNPLIIWCVVRFLSLSWVKSSFHWGKLVDHTCPVQKSWSILFRVWWWVLNEQFTIIWKKTVTDVFYALQGCTQDSKQKWSSLQNKDSSCFIFEWTNFMCCFTGTSLEERSFGQISGQSLPPCNPVWASEYLNCINNVITKYLYFKRCTTWGLNLTSSRITSLLFPHLCFSLSPTVYD